MTTSPQPGAYRYATPRVAGEGLRIGVTRHPPRGIRREDWQKKGYYDLWLPLLAPSADLLKSYLEEQVTWAVFARRYHTEMKQPACRQMIATLAAFSYTTPFSLGCFCEDETRCHRSLLLPLVLESRKAFHKPRQAAASFASPPCYLEELGVMDDP